MFGKRIGFLKFKAEIIDKETGNKVAYYLHNIFSLLVCRGVFMSQLHHFTYWPILFSKHYLNYDYGYCYYYYSII